jgi:2-polyprenyl-6-methoxyphenol hydroxylase-like FAD-dependent oxidoreductase
MPTLSSTAQPQEESNAQKHVVVVGAGPVGMMSALKLSQAGIHVTIIEKVTS